MGREFELMCILLLMHKKYAPGRAGALIACSAGEVWDPRSCSTCVIMMQECPCFETSSGGLVVRNWDVRLAGAVQGAVSQVLGTAAAGQLGVRWAWHKLLLLTLTFKLFFL